MAHQGVLLPPPPGAPLSEPGQGCPGPALAWGPGEGWRRAIQEGTSVTRGAPEALLLLKREGHMRHDPRLKVAEVQAGLAERAWAWDATP